MSTQMTGTLDPPRSCKQGESCTYCLLGLQLCRLLAISTAPADYSLGGEKAATCCHAVAHGVHTRSERFRLQAPEGICLETMSSSSDKPNK